MNEQLRGGFVYTLEHVRDGQVIDREVVRNLMPTEGVNHMLSTQFKGTAQVATWYIGIYEGNYTPTIADTAAGLPAAATETTAYTAATRVEFVEGAVSGGSLDNSASKAEFVFNAAKTIYGAFMSSVATKGAVSGVLASVVKFSSPKTFGSGDTLRVTAGFTLASA